MKRVNEEEHKDIPYLPQTVVSKEVFDSYVAKLLPIDISGFTGFGSEDNLSEFESCKGGCPIR